MRFHVASYAPAETPLKTYARSPWPLLGAGIFCLAVFLAALVGWLGIFELDGQPLRWRISLEIAILPLFLAGVCLYMARLTLGQRSWLVKRYADGLLLNARLVPRKGEGDEGVSQFFLEWAEIAWARLRNEVRYLKGPIPGHRQRRETTYVELHCVSPQCDQLRQRLGQEAERQGLCPGDLCPLEYAGDGTLLLRWDVSPGPEEFLKTLADRVSVREPVVLPG